ncbi:choice-of-anchor D domain-containing protein [bacterium]|nr:choice-of-anchor D domain-containing protein [bacterium]
MKSRTILCLTLLVLGVRTHAQVGQWSNFTNGDNITAIAQQNDTLWIGTGCGLVKFDRNLGEPIAVYDRINSILPVLAITDVVVDQNGDKWIGTPHGLIRISGSNWRIYDTDKGLPSNSITALTLNASGLPVAGTVSSGFGEYSMDVDSFFITNTLNTPSLPSNEILDLTYDTASDFLWAATYNGVAQRNIDIWQVWNNTTGLPANWITSVALDTSRAPWVGTGATGVSHYVVGSQWTTYQAGVLGFPANDIRCIAVDALNVPWVGTGSGGLTTFPGTSWVTYNETGVPELPNNNIQSLLIDTDNAKWVGTSEGLAKLAGTLWTSGFNTSNSGLPDQYVRQIAPRHLAGGMWMNTGSDLALYDGLSWQIQNSETSVLPNTFYSHIMTDNTDRLFVGTEGLGAYLYNGVSWQTFTTGSSQIPSDYILSGDVDIDNTIWIGTENGLGKLVGTTWTVYNSQNTIGLQDNYIPKVKTDLNGTVWMASETFGLTVFDPISETASAAPTGLAATYIQDMDVDNENRLWVATDIGLWVLIGQNWGLYTTDNSRLPTDFIRAVAVSPIGNVWIGTSQGLVKFAPGDTAVYDISNSGLIDNNIQDIGFDMNGDIWIGTERGLALFTAGETGTAQLSLSQNTLNYGSVVAGTSADRYDVLTNIGNADLVIDTLEIAGAQAGAFSVIRTIDTAVGQGLSDSTGVRFSPPAAGTYQARLMIYSNAPTSPDSVILQGVGGAASLAFDLNRADFGIVYPGNVVQQTVTLTNSGTAPAQITNTQITGSADFTILQGGAPPAVTVNAGASHEMILEFAPATTGIKNAELIVTHTALNSPAILPVIGSGGSPRIVMNPDAVDFGRVQVNTTQSRTVQIINNGSSVLNIISVNMTAPTGSGFSITSGAASTVQPGDTTAFTIAFTPTDLFASSAVVTVESNTLTGVETLNVRGRGVAFQIDPASLPAVVSADAPFILQLNIGDIIATDVWLYYQQPGQADWDSTQFVRNGLTLTGTIEADSIHAEGLSYYVATINVLGAREYLSGEPGITSNWLPVTTPSVQSGHPTLNGVYGMQTFPYHLVNRNIGRIFADEIGDYNTKLWRIFYWWYDSAQDTAYYREYNPLETIWNAEPGKAFWVITQDTVRFDLDDVRSVDARMPYQILLHKGWNQIGNPFTFPVLWDSVEVRGTTVQPPVARDELLNQYVFNMSVLYPWGGYFVYANGPGELRVPPVQAPGTLPKSGTTRSYAAGELELQLRAVGRSSGLIDAVNFIGMLHNASDFIDDHDWFEPPAIGDALELSFVENKIKYAANYKKVSDLGAAWEFQVHSTAGEELVQLTLEPKNDMPDHFQVWLLDRDRGKVIPVENNQALFSAPKKLAILVGTEEFADSRRGDIPLVPISYMLDQNFPNPFNPSTVIAFQLAERSDVRLDIYNVLGKRVKTLVHESLPAGRHRRQWDGTDDFGNAVASGLYFYRLSSPGFTQSKKLIRLH